MTPLSGSTPDPHPPERLLRFAVSSGNGFFDAESTEAACRWAVEEIDGLRLTLATICQCVDQMRLWEPHTKEHKDAMRRLVEVTNV